MVNNQQKSSPSNKLNFNRLARLFNLVRQIELDNLFILLLLKYN